MKRFLLALSLVLVFPSLSLADRSWTILTAGSVVNAPITGDGSIGSPLSCATCIVSGGPLGTPSSGIGTNFTGIPIAGLTGLGAGVDTALGIAVTGSGGIALKTNAALVTPDLGTPSAGVLTNATGYPAASLAGLGAGVGTFLGAPTVANLNAATTDNDVATLAGTETLTSKQLTSPKIGTSILDTGGNILFSFIATASAVNYLQYNNGAAGSPPKFTAIGSDTDLGIQFNTKALGNFILQPGTDQSDTLDILTAAGGHAMRLGTFPGAATYGAFWPGNGSPDNTNYALIGNGTTETVVNSPTTTSTLFFRQGGTTRMQIAGSGIAAIGTTTTNSDSRLEVAGHITIEGTAPALSACGTSPSIVGNDVMGKVTTGSGVITSCTLTFATAWANAPACVVNDETAVQLASGVSTTTTLVISSATAITSQVISYSCFGRG